MVSEAYYGIGTISRFLTKQVKHVYGVEIVLGTIEDAKKNADLNKITNLVLMPASQKLVCLKRID